VCVYVKENVCVDERERERVEDNSKHFLLHVKTTDFLWHFQSEKNSSILSENFFLTPLSYTI